ncbi:MAG: Ig-like domain-containing protein [Candidatus Dadabacteria bacterium]
MILKTAKACAVLLCSTLLIVSCKKTDVITEPQITDPQSIRMGGLVPDDPIRLSKVPLIISSSYLAQKTMLMRKGGNSKGINPGTPSTGDLTPPSVTITSPTDGSSITGTLSIAVNASDNVGVKTVSYTIDGISIGSSSTSPFGISWSSSSLADGVHSLIAWAYDAAGNYSSSSSISLTKNTIVINPPPAPSTGTSFSLTMPPVGYQGSEGSCVAFAVGYAARSTEWFYKTGGSAYTYYSNIFSPEFLYDLTKANGDCSAGSNIMIALDYIKANGICTWSDMPYSYTDGCSTVPNSFQQANALNYKISDYSALYKSDVAGIKAQLLNHHPVMFGCNLDNTFINAQPGFIWRSYTAAPGIGHGMVICGFDDAKHAWKIMNSWGTGWCEGGFGWIDYDFFPNTGGEWAFVII